MSKKVMTIGDMRDDENDDQEEGQGYYAGGGERSGQLILDPSDRRNKDPSEVVNSMFSHAQEEGVSPDESQARRAGESRFAGTGYSLGAASVPSEVYSAPQPPLSRTLTVWQNGFSIDDGPLMDMEQPNNVRIFQSVLNGQAPPELLDPTDPQRKVDLTVTRRNEPYVPSARSSTFAGDGHVLASAAERPSAVPSVAHPNKFVYDDSKPGVAVAIRLHDGTRVVQHFNETHTVADVYAFVALRTRVDQFELSMTMPRKVISDMDKSVLEAGLKGAALNQRLL